MKHLSSILLLAALLLSACGGPEGVRITEGTQTIGRAPAGTVYTTNEASIVHVKMSTRIATIRNGRSFEEGAFLIVEDRAGKQSGVLKALPNRESGLRMADILEGEPMINHTVRTAGAAESEQLSKIYRDPEQD